MQSLTLNQIFGEGAFQNESILVIQKASLLKLTPSSTNTAESLLSAILITALTNFRGVITNENNQTIANENNQAITYDNSEAFELIKMIEWTPFQFKRDNQKYLNNQIILERYTLNAN